MIKSLKFRSEESINNFIRDNKVQLISIETIEEEYDTGLRLPNGKTFITTREVYKLWYNTDEQVI